MKTRLKSTLLLIVIFQFTACDFLDEIPDAVINTETFYQTEEDAIAATNALYEYLTVGTEGIFDTGFGGIFFNDYWVIKDILSDNCLTNIASNEYATLNEFSFNANNIRIELYWQDIYKVIHHANVVADRVPEIDMDESRRDHLVAEARFIRAMMYFEAVRLFGDVPLILGETLDINDALIARTPTEDIYDAIVEDLEWSIDHLSTSFRVGLGRPTVMACHALLSKVYLETGEYQNAANEAQIVVESGIHPLFQYYGDLWQLENANSGEIIMAINYSGTLSQGFKPNQYHVRLLPSGLSQFGGPENAWGWERPTDNLLNSFDPQDQRAAHSFITSFVPDTGPTIFFDPHIGKFWDQEDEPRGNNTDMDVIYLRTADIMLVYAEALNEINTGPNAVAYDMINQVRERARYNGTTYLNILPDLSGMNYQQFKDAILEERRWELVMEGQRYHDLVRHGKLVEKVNASGKANVNAQSFHTLLPIPQRERNLNSNLGQNTGY
ncbi:MAG: RagB/SusD family nutrient uptake outer membrane protein [Cyclobacteriaceae bacterium]